jgi:uncharacterized protein with HEPN domain
MRDDRGRLQDILDAIKRIERYAKRGRRVFEEDELVHTWMIHHIQIIGEAARKLTPTFRKTHHQVPWPQIIKMRHGLVDGYLRHQIHARGSQAICSLLQRLVP